MNEINDAFIKSVEVKIDECSSIIQLKECFDRYKPYAYNKYIFNAFANRIDFFRVRSVDCFITEQCDYLMEDLECEKKITSICEIGGVPSSNEDIAADNVLEINLIFDSQEGTILYDAIHAAIQLCLEKSCGKKREAARLLGIEYQDFVKITKDHRELKGYLRRLRKDLKKKLPKA